MGPSMRDIANFAKVSVGTVSNVLNHPNKVSDETLAKVREAMKTLGFKTKFVSKLISSHSKIIGLVLPLSGNSFFEEFTIGFEDAISTPGLRVLVGFSRESAESESELIASMIDADFMGVVVIPSEYSFNSVEKFDKQFVRYAYISQTDELPDACSLSIDQLRGGFIGLQHLHQLGHRNILWISGPDNHYPSFQRLVGITQASKDMGIHLTTMQALSLDHQAGINIGQRIIADGPLPDAIFAANDLVARGIISYFTSVGISVPGDISVLGYDNISSVEFDLIPLSTVSQSPYLLGKIVAQQLLTDIFADEDHDHEHLVFHSHVVERASTASKVIPPHP